MSTIKIPAAVVIQEVADEAVVLNTDNGQYYGLNEVGRRMVELVRACGDADAVTRQIEREYEVTAEQARTDLEKLLTDLESHGLVERVA